jgi:hypothetical protein
MGARGVEVSKTLFYLNMEKTDSGYIDLWKESMGADKKGIF